MLGPSIDKQNEDEDALTVVDGVPFIASGELTGGYGEHFELRFEEGRLLVNSL